MISFLVRRLLLLIPVLLGILIITFSLARLIPGDPCTIALGEHATPAACNAYLDRMGLNDPLPTQFVRYLTSEIPPRPAEMNKMVAANIAA